MNNNISTIKHEITTILKNKIHQIIKADLTIGRTDNDLPPLTDEEIYKIYENDVNPYISKMILLMINDYESSSELLLLKNPEFDWIREYLYIYVDTNQYIETDNKNLL